MSIKQYIITCFNISTHNVTSSINSELQNIDTNRDPKYLQYRFDLFEKYTFPSIKAQWFQDFEWIVLFHSETPEIFKKRIDKYQIVMPNFKPIFLSQEEGPNRNQIFSEYMKEHPADWYITTRLDNDDALHCQYLQKVRESVCNIGLKHYAVNFRYGLRYIHCTGQFELIEISDNHFYSLVAPYSNIIDHGFWHHHHLLSKDLKVIDIGEKRQPMWIEVEHKSNFLNGVQEHNNAASILEGFDIDLNQTEVEMIRLHQNQIKPIIISVMSRYRITKSLVRIIHNFRD